MRVLLIHPQIRLLEPPRHPPYGLLGLAAITDSMGYKVAIFDNNAFRVPIDAIRQSIKEEKEGWDIIGISGLTTQYRFIKEIVPVAREECPDALIVGGGGCFSTLPFHMLKWLKEVDIACIGESYITWREILEAKDLNSLDWKHVKGLAYREGSKVKLSSMRPLISEEDLDTEIPWPAYEFSPVEVYLQNSLIPFSPEALTPVANFQEPRRRLDVCASYGCAFRCNFCVHPNSYCKVFGKEFKGKPFRQHTPQYVANLILHLRNRYAVNFISFLDENFTTNRTWFNSFCDTLEDQDLVGVIQWGCVGHARTVDAEMLKRGRECGMTYISYGGETPSAHLLQDIGKGQTAEQMTAALQATHAANINPIMSFIIGFPKTTIDDIIEHCQYFIDNQIHTRPFFLQPYPGSQLFEENKDKIIEQNLTPEEKAFINSPSLEALNEICKNQKAPPIAKYAKKDNDLVISKIKESALERWILSLDDALRLSVNLTDFPDEVLAGFQTFIDAWDIDRLKKYKARTAGVIT